MADSEISGEDRRQAEEEWQKIQNDPDYYQENYVDVTDEFLPSEVDSLLADLQLGEVSSPEFRNRFERLSEEHKSLFLEHLPDCFPPNKRKSA